MLSSFFCAKKCVSCVSWYLYVYRITHTNLMVYLLYARLHTDKNHENILRQIGENFLSFSHDFLTISVSADGVK